MTPPGVTSISAPPGGSVPGRTGMVAGPAHSWTRVLAAVTTYSPMAHTPDRGQSAPHRPPTALAGVSEGRQPWLGSGLSTANSAWPGSASQAIRPTRGRPSQPSTATGTRQPNVAPTPAAAPSPRPPSSGLASGPLTATANAVRADADRSTGLDSKEACDSWRASEPEAQRRAHMASFVVEEREGFYRGRELTIVQP
ncbi:hypothetical protein QF035_010718 [Streptomyces umbrinus]|uniref:Uncharacterized protein n=1 Tax=Streptomyces umbrinus TaxID=67370 RepID=A0ABU0TBD6_9ACTN|nr:hypothetical protein [Streptomyces umbrinus]